MNAFFHTAKLFTSLVLPCGGVLHWLYCRDLERTAQADLVESALDTRILIDSRLNERIFSTCPPEAAIMYEQSKRVVEQGPKTAR